MRCDRVLLLVIMLLGMALFMQHRACRAAVPEWCKYVMSPAGEDGPCVEVFPQQPDGAQPTPPETGSESPADGREDASKQDRRQPVYTT